MFHSRDSPRLLVCDTGLYMGQNDIGFITVAICGGYISKYPRLGVCIDGKFNFIEHAHRICSKVTQHFEYTLSLMIELFKI